MLNCNFIDLATRIFCGEDVQPQPVDLDTIHHTAVKVPQFSFARLLGADPVLGTCFALQFTNPLFSTFVQMNFAITL